jgi:hypothetical protein
VRDSSGTRVINHPLPGNDGSVVVEDNDDDVEEEDESVDEEDDC